MLRTREFRGAVADRSSRDSLLPPAEVQTIEAQAQREPLPVRAETDEMRSIDRAAAREQAERCFRLAASITDREVTNRLIELGRQYEEAGYRPRQEDEALTAVRTSE
jgi:hypothetical protein